MVDKALDRMTDSEYLYELARMYTKIPSPEMQEHADRLNTIRSRFEVLERQVSFHFKEASFEKRYGHKFVLTEPARKPSINHHNPVPTPHILG